MKNVGKFNGLNIWVPDTGDVIADQRSFALLRYHIAQFFPMYKEAPKNSEAAESCQLPTTGNKSKPADITDCIHIADNCLFHGSRYCSKQCFRYETAV